MTTAKGLAGTRCVHCGYRSFPWQDYGCESCGSERLARIELRGAGTLVAAATVHRHAGQDGAAPFTAVSVRLDDGPSVIGLLDHPGEPEPGVRVHAVRAGGEVRFAEEAA
ncbi:putative OB-fold protein [Lipingzhangella halophila]|uniref:Putative OB-fold protein n=1 Tax=Lipingzhangella halophila TaxID=1783352 RepID=A0A7W7RN02_9ACTN|nr:OB-fold domain-containing protein [Lipingzhangella halophila]MBB4934969.1 putative OB-fold protein [Lipingzhangella halophila]